MMTLSNKVRDATRALIDANTPKASSNIGKLAALYSTAKLVYDVADAIMDEHKDTLRDAAMFDDGNKAIIYDNKLFALHATKSAPRRTFDRMRAIVVLAKQFKLTTDEATALVDQFYKVGDASSVSLSVKVK
jgi:hypothetical protein